MSIFIYHPDNVIYRNGKYVSSFAEFINEYPDFPIIEGQFFEFSNNGFSLVDNKGDHILPLNLQDYEPLIIAINNLE